MWIRNRIINFLFTKRTERVLVKFSCWIPRIWQIKAKTKLIFRRKETTHESIAWNPGSTVWPACTSPMVLCTYYCQYYRSNQGSSTHKVTSTPPLLQAAIVQNLFVKAALCCLLLRRGGEAQPTVIVSAALSFSLTSKTCCCPPATSMYNQPPATFLYTARDDTKFLYPSRLTTNVYASSFLEPMNDSIMHNTLWCVVSFMSKESFCFCFDLPISGHSTAEFHQNLAHFVNKQ